MKFSLICLLAGLCLVSVSVNLLYKILNEKLVLLHILLFQANIEVSTSVEDDFDLDYEYSASDLAEDITADVDPYVIPWLGIYFVIRKALSAIKGVKCTVKEVVIIKNAAQAFIDDIQLCGDDVNAKAKQLNETCKNIITTANNIINVNETICGSTSTATSATTLNLEDDVMEPALHKTKIKCFFKLLGKTLKLKNQIRRAIRLIKQIPKVPGKTNECVSTAADNLGNVFNQFPSKVKYCSKLLH